jgi:hypothetical protein
MTALHYHAFTFISSSLRSPVTTHASVYIGYADTKISLPRIQAAKEAAGVPPDAVLLSVSYLGHMTPSEMDSHS